MRRTKLYRQNTGLTENRTAATFKFVTLGRHVWNSKTYVMNPRTWTSPVCLHGLLAVVLDQRKIKLAIGKVTGRMSALSLHVRLLEAKHLLPKRGRFLYVVNFYRQMYDPSHLRTSQSGFKNLFRTHQRLELDSVSARIQGHHCRLFSDSTGVPVFRGNNERSADDPEFLGQPVKFGL